jgi:hypothetical protein
VFGRRPVDLIDDDDRVSGGEKLGCDERLSAAVGQQLLEGGHELASTAEVTELLREIVAKRARKCRGDRRTRLDTRWSRLLTHASSVVVERSAPY